MNDGAHKTSDPARDLLRSLDILSAGGAATVADRIAVASRTTPWSKDFFHVIKVVQDTIDYVHNGLVDGEDLDSEHEEDLRSEVNRLRSVFNISWLASSYANASQSSAPLGPETRTFLKSASRQLRGKAAYYDLNPSDISLIESTIATIRKDLDGFRLEKAEFAREALLRGCEEVSFILARIDFLGFSRLEKPVMELGAFLFTVSVELEERDGNRNRIIKSLSSLGNTFDRLYKLSKVASGVNLAFDGANWLISHLKD